MIQPAQGPALKALAGATVVVAGGGITGQAAESALRQLGARPALLDDADGSAARGLPSGTRLMVISPGLPPTHPLRLEAQQRGIPVWGEVELAWRLAQSGSSEAPWLVVTGTNGKTSTTQMLAAILAADRRRTVACGNIGLPVVTAVTDGVAYDVLAVELSSFQLFSSPSVRPMAGAILNLAPDHLDWHGTMSAYAESKLRAYGDATTVAVGVREGEGSLELLRRAPGRQVVVTLGPPGPGEMGMVRQHGGAPLLVDRAFAPGAPSQAEQLASLDELPRITAAHELTNALAAAALARAYGVEAEAVARGLAAFTPGEHRRALVAEVGGVRFIDDSKATNPHAALVSVTAVESAVLIAGGLDRGLDFEDFARTAAGHVRAVVLLGESAGRLAESFARHAPQIPVTRVSSLEDGVREAIGLAREGDTVLLAPAAASQDMFTSYAERGDRFAAAVLAYAGAH